MLARDCSPLRIVCKIRETLSVLVNDAGQRQRIGGCVQAGFVVDVGLRMRIWISCLFQSPGNVIVIRVYPASGVGHRRELSAAVISESQLTSERIANRSEV